MQEIEIRSGAIDAGLCLSKGWEIIKPNYFLFFGMTFFMIVCSIVLSLIPYVGWLINLLISGPLLCGIYISILAASRNEPVEFSMLFTGFSRFGTAVLFVLIQNSPMLLFSAALLALGAANPATFIGQGGNGPISFQGMSTAIILLSVAFYGVLIIVSIVSFFGLQLIADRGVGIGQAITLTLRAAGSNIGGVILVFLVEILVGLVGVLALCVGILFALPVIYAINVAAYQMVFPASDSSTEILPPPPTEFGDGYGNMQS